MKLLFELSGECEPLARSEVLSASAVLGGKPKLVSTGRGIVVADVGCSPSALLARLGLCHHVSEWLCSSDPNGLVDAVAEIDVPGPISVRSTRVGEAHRDLDLSALSKSVGAVVGRGRGVDLESPASEIRVVLSDEVHVGRLLGSVDRGSFEARRNQNLPFIHPISLHPKFARALVNLTEVPSSGRMLDPFCGTGAIVAESLLVGLNAVGTDLSEKMIAGARRNLEHLGLSAELHVCDVGMVKTCVGEVDGIATDPPYGRSTSTGGEELADLFARSIATFSDLLESGSRIAVVAPERAFLDRCEGFSLLEVHSLWVHRSLTRHFAVLRKD